MLSVIRSGIDASLKQLDVLSHNLSNAKTTGYKKSVASFRDVYSEKISLLSPQKIGNGSTLNEVRQMRSQGAFKETGQVLDLAIEGEGMFVLGDKDESELQKAFFTRDGSFSIDEEGFIVSSIGKRLKSISLEDIKVPTFSIVEEKKYNLSDLNISKNGMVQGTFLIDADETLIPGQNKSIITNLGRVGLASFPNPTKLQSSGSNLFIATQRSGLGTVGSPLEGSNGKIYSGAIEMSNVNMTSELASLLQAQRAFSGASRLLQTEVNMVKNLTG